MVSVALDAQHLMPVASSTTRTCNGMVAKPGCVVRPTESIAPRTSVQWLSQKRKSDVSVTRSPIHASSSSFTLKTCQVRAKKGPSAPQCVEAYSLDWAEGSRWRLHKSKWPRCRAIANFFAKRESQTDTYSNQE